MGRRLLILRSARPNVLVRALVGRSETEIVVLGAAFPRGDAGALPERVQFIDWTAPRFHPRHIAEARRCLTAFGPFDTVAILHGNQEGIGYSACYLFALLLAPTARIESIGPDGRASPCSPAQALARGGCAFLQWVGGETLSALSLIPLILAVCARVAWRRACPLVR